MKTLDVKIKTGWKDFELNVDLRLSSSGVTAVFGESGSGKTTLLRSLAGLARPEIAEIIFNGEIWQSDKIWLPTHKRSIGFVFQDASLFPHLTVIENLKFGEKRAKASDRCFDLTHVIDLLGISKLLGRKPHELSGGESQRVGIARAIAVQPKLLLMDEPLSSLDYRRKQEILPYLKNVKNELAIPIVYVSHSIDEVYALADRVIVLENGRVSNQGAASEVLPLIDPLLSTTGETQITAEVGGLKISLKMTESDYSRLGIKPGDIVKGEISRK